MTDRAVGRVRGPWPSGGRVHPWADGGGRPRGRRRVVAFDLEPGDPLAPGEQLPDIPLAEVLTTAIEVLKDFEFEDPQVAAAVEQLNYQTGAAALP